MTSYISQDIIKKLIDLSNIVEIISENIFLKQSGKNFLGLCPFHEEKTPSFTVSPNKQIYYCFGCGQGGNIFSFLMKYKGLSFPESVSLLADRHGISISNKYFKRRIEDSNLVNSQLLVKINFDAMIFFHKNLIKLDEKHPIKVYLKNRGLNRKTISEFKIGYAPIHWHSLEKHLSKKEWFKKTITSSGLIISKNNISYDRFRNRIIFPIYNSVSSIIGFGGRVIDSSMPKYINSPETNIYTKGKSLYGIDKAKTEIRKTELVFIVEGFFDLISLHQFGIKNSVAILGTSITKEHVRQIKSIIGESGKIILVYDSDQAGLKAARRSLDIFQRENLDTQVMILPTGHDPDSFITKFGPKQFIAESKKAISAISFIINLEIDKNGFDINGKIKIVNSLKHFISTNENTISRALNIQYLSEQIGVDELTIKREVNSQIAKNLKMSFASREEPQKHQKYIVKNKECLIKTYKLERKILSMILQSPEMIGDIISRGIVEQFKNKSFRKIANLAISKSSEKQQYLNNIIEECSNKEERSVIAKLALTEEKWNRNECRLLIKQFKSIMTKENDDLMKKIVKAEQNGNNKLLFELLEKKQLIAKRRINIMNIDEYEKT